MPELVMAEPHRILILEDDGFIGWHLADELEAAGFAVAGPFISTGEAMEYLAREMPSAAIVDVMLRDGVCDAVGDLLESRGIPFLVHSAVNPRDPGGSLEAAPWFGKPRKAAHLIEALAAILPPIDTPAGFRP
jgi:DNA-binding response OmpR family regulator